ACCQVPTGTAARRRVGWTWANSLSMYVTRRSCGAALLEAIQQRFCSLFCLYAGLRPIGVGRSALKPEYGCRPKSLVRRHTRFRAPYRTGLRLRKYMMPFLVSAHVNLKYDLGRLDEISATVFCWGNRHFVTARVKQTIAPVAALGIQ